MSWSESSGSVKGFSAAHQRHTMVQFVMIVVGQRSQVIEEERIQVKDKERNQVKEEEAK